MPRVGQNSCDPRSGVLRKAERSPRAAASGHFGKMTLGKLADDGRESEPAGAAIAARDDGDAGMFV